jgi:thiol-disulfide isomerase/thioredoxin
VPAATINAVAGGKATPPTGVGDAALTSDGKPEILYVGAEYCPYCAAERWPLVQALTRFGTFSNLSLTTSASDDVHPNTPTFSFHGATYSSPYLSFVGKELYTNKRVGGVYEPLDKLTDAEQQIFQAHTQGFPFIDVGGRYVVTGATYESGVLDGQSAPAIAAALANPDSATAQGVIGAANRITAAICQVTGGKPANVCTAPGVAKLAAQVAQ